jgi:hypothetical protein
MQPELLPTADCKTALLACCTSADEAYLDVAAAGSEQEVHWVDYDTKELHMSSYAQQASARPACCV